MYGRGNYVPQFGQGLQRPMPPYQQLPGGHPPPLQFQPVQPFPMQPVIQQGGPPRLGPPPGPGYPHVPPAALNMPPQGPPNASQSFLQRPLLHGGPPPRHPYPSGQHNFTSTRPPPSIGPPRGLPQPPLQHSAGYGAAGVHNISFRPPPPPPPAMSQPPTVFFPSPSFEPATQQHGAGSHMPLPSQPPPQPPHPSVPIVPEPSFIPAHVTGGSPMTHGDVPGQNQALEPESTAEVETESGEEGTSIAHTDLSSKVSAPLELPPPPPKPADEAVVRNIEVLCQFIAKNGSQFEEMARKNESGNPKFSFLVGGEPGTESSCAHEYYLWMKKKCGLLNDPDNGEEQKNLSQVHADGMASVVLNSSANMATVHSPADSDVDMEDDITQIDKEPEVYTLGEDLKSEPVSTREVLEMQEQETMLVYARDNSSAINSNLPAKSEEKAETKPENSSGQLGRIDSPFRLIQNYASDDNSEDELPQDQCEAQTVPTPPRSGFSTLCDDIKNDTTSEPVSTQSVTACVDSLLMKEEALAVQSESGGTCTKGFSSRNHEMDDRFDGDEPSNLNAAFQGRIASESGGVDTVISKDIEFNDKKSTSTAPKMDEFGRIAKGGASDSEPDDTQRARRRGRRDRSRSRSRSPSDRRRRRSPYRGKGRRSRSRSRSPKRRRSRSRSPHRSRGDFGGENLRRGRAQAQECFDFIKGRCYRGASCRYLHHDVGKSESSRRYKGKHGDDDDWTSKPNDENRKAESIIDVVPNVLHEDVENSIVDFKDGKDHREDAAYVKGALGEHMPHLPISEEHPTVGMPSTSQTVHHSSSEGPQEHGGDLQTMVATGKTEFSAVETSVVSPTRISTESYHGLASNEPTGPSASISDIPNQISHPPTPPLASEGMNAPQQSKELLEYNSITPSATFPLHMVPLHVAPSYQTPLPSQQSHYPPNSAWSILPPSHPHPPHPVDLSNTSAPLQFQPGSIPFKTDLPNQISSRAEYGELSRSSQAGGLQYQTYRPPSRNVSGTPFAGPSPSLVRDDRLSQFPSHGHGSAGFFAPGVPPQPGLFPGNSNVMHSFPGNTMLAEDSSKQALHNHQLPQPPTFGPSLTSADSMPSNLGGSQSVSRHASDSLVREHPSHFVDVGQSKISAHYNPYASTFDQPLSSRFSSAFAQERVSASGVKYDGSFSLSHGSIEGQSASGYGSGAGGRMPRSGGDQYDPLFDSIEPSSKRAQKQDRAADNSDMLTVGSHQRVLDVADNKQKAVGAGVATTSLDNDEYGETADAEVGVVENGSLSETDDDDIVAEGEIEIDQINPGGDNKKSKDSRSMKLFKIAVANFVKEVLKPQWRQGNMSKEVFKTIVKKTVDKVSGAMKNHRVPKSQAKIDHYIDSSRRKLTQLVEGYVSKYKS